VTTVPRTLLDLAAVIGLRELERAVNQAEVLRLGDPLALDDLVSRHPGRRGTVALRTVLDGLGVGADVTRSELEDRFLSFLVDAQLPHPQVNVALQVSGHWLEADCVWRLQRLVVELDGHAAHGTRAAYEQDRARDRILQAAGWRVVRITWRQLHHAPAAVASDLRRLLGISSSLGSER
jgi:very-short-patch-repair endonuclease